MQRWNFNSPAPRPSAETGHGSGSAPKSCIHHLKRERWDADAWYDPEPGRNPAFLYQENTIRDAVVAALTLHIFQDHAERVKMGNLAQLVNVLQAPILTEGENNVDMVILKNRLK